MKRAIYTIVVMGLISSVLVNSAYAGNRHGGGINPLWVPVAILSTLVAAVTIAESKPVAYERRVHIEPRQTVIYEEPRHYRHEQYYDNNTRNYRDGNERCESRRYRE